MSKGARGPFGPIVFSAMGPSPSVRARPTPTHSSGPSACRQRANMHNAAMQWSRLTAAQKLSWHNARSQGRTGYGQFLMTNLPRLSAGLTMTSAPGSAQILAPLEQCLIKWTSVKHTAFQLRRPASSAVRAFLTVRYTPLLHHYSAWTRRGRYTGLASSVPNQTLTSVSFTKARAVFVELLLTPTNGVGISLMAKCILWDDNSLHVISQSSQLPAPVLWP
jgi:hypothetical protein